MTLTRRRFLAGSAGLAAGAMLPACHRLGVVSGASVGPSGAFAHGVASGDPLADRVLLWTRVTPPPEAASTGKRILVRWEIASDPGFARLEGRGSGETGSERDYTFKVDAGDLAPGRSYYYRFFVGDTASPIGRTRTLPVGPLARARFGVCSCSHYSAGYFNAYRSLAARNDLDAVLHLGDYIYEYERGGFGDGGLGRDPEPAHEIVTLADYRARYAQYRGDPDLQEVHRQHPMIAIWDDHESANNAWSGGAENHQPDEGEWSVRKAVAARAYFEWMPIRELPGELPSTRASRTYRSFRYGDLVDLVMLDTRLVGRDEQVARSELAKMDAPSRSLLGAAQEAWLQGEIERSHADGTAWRVLGQQVMLGQMALPGAGRHNDGWDGYGAARARLLGQLEASDIRDVVVLTGDYHSSWALDVPPDPFSPDAYDPDTGRGARAVEFVAPAISAPAIGSVPRLAELFAHHLETRPHLRFMDLDHNGYFVLDLDRERVQADWYWQASVAEPRVSESFGAAFASERGRSRVEARSEPSADAAGAEPAPSA